MATQEGYEQIVQILLENGANVDLADQVLFLVLIFGFFFFLLFFIYLFSGWNNSSFYCC